MGECNTVRTPGKRGYKLREEMNTDSSADSVIDTALSFGRFSYNLLP
jgi:hypothetical protein